MKLLKITSQIFCLSILALSISPINFVLAASSLSATNTNATVSASDQVTREQCFATLKENLVEAGTFTDPLVELSKMTYADIEPNFSQNYKNLASFGIELDKPNLEMRVYSFGRQTGYVHPPKMPFPSSYKSDMWIGPTKQFIVSEEYSVDQSGNKQFISCSFFSIGAEDLLKVTRENYAYDGALISLTKTASDNSYKAWYSQNSSFDYDDKPFVSWTRLFIYPQATENSYFDKYSVADAFPANKVASFDVLKFLLKAKISLNDYDGSGTITNVKYLVPDSEGKLVEMETPKELLPIQPEGLGKVFPLTTYYQAIESRFPEFATALSLRGTLKYETYKRIITDPNLDPEIKKIVDTIKDPRQISLYSIDKEINEQQGMSVSNPDMDNMLVKMQDADAAISEISEANIKPESTQVQDSGNHKNKIQLLIGVFILCLFTVSTVVYLWWRKQRVENNNFTTYE